MNDEVACWTTLLNESMDMCGLPIAYSQRQKVFVHANEILNNYPSKIVRLVDDYGLICRLFYWRMSMLIMGSLLQDRTELGVGGFV